MWTGEALGKQQVLVKNTYQVGGGDGDNAAGIRGGGVSPSSSFSGPNGAGMSSEKGGRERPRGPDRHHSSSPGRCRAFAALTRGPVSVGTDIQMVQWEAGVSPSPANRRRLLGRAGPPGQWENLRADGAGWRAEQLARAALRTGHARGARAVPGAGRWARRVSHGTGPTLGAAVGPLQCALGTPHPARGPGDTRLGAGAALRSRPRRAPGRLGRRAGSAGSQRLELSGRAWQGLGWGGVFGWESKSRPGPTRSVWGSEPSSAPLARLLRRGARDPRLAGTGPFVRGLRALPDWPGPLHCTTPGALWPGLCIRGNFTTAGGATGTGKFPGGGAPLGSAAAHRGPKGCLRIPLLPPPGGQGGWGWGALSWVHERCPDLGPPPTSHLHPPLPCATSGGTPGL